MKQIEAIIFDADGVVIKFDRYATEQIEEDQGLDLGALQPFFEKEFALCVKGEIDLKESLAPYLADSEWSGSLEAFLKNWFEYENKPNQQLLQKVSQLRKQGVKCYLATNQEKYRAHFIAEDMGFLKLFDHCFFSSEMHTVKPELKFYEYVWQSIQYMDFIDEKANVMFFDDQQKNVDAARHFGFKAYVFDGNEKCKKILANLY